LRVKRRRSEGQAVPRAGAGTADTADSADARRLLIDALNDKESQTRISAIWALGSTGDVHVVPDIERMYASGDAGVRKIAVYALGSMPSRCGQ
jgi:HEAT repeat protein